MEYRALGKTGMKVSVIGYGASPMGNEFGETDAGEGVRAVHHAIDSGINFFDVAPFYGRTLAEKRLGAALKGKRDKVHLATKCGQYDLDASGDDYSAVRVFTSIDESLRRLQTDYVDLLQVHNVESAPVEQILEETIPAMRKVQRSGKARWVGITGLPLKMLRCIAGKTDVDTILTFCRYNLLAADMDDLLTPLCKNRDIGLINGGPLHMGILTEKGPPPWHPAPPAVTEAGRKIVEFCKARGMEVGQVALRFCLDHPVVATTLVGMSKQAHVEANLKALAFRNTPELLAGIEAVVAPVKNRLWMEGRPENNDENWKEPA